MRVSRLFLCALIGIAMTLFAWYGPWAWPAWPAFTALNLMFGSGERWDELPHGQRALVLVALILINVGFWAAVAWLAYRLAGAVRNRVKR
jgi:hypothetical protein